MRQAISDWLYEHRREVGSIGAVVVVAALVIAIRWPSTTPSPAAPPSTTAATTTTSTLPTSTIVAPPTTTPAPAPSLAHLAGEHRTLGVGAVITLPLLAPGEHYSVSVSRPNVVGFAELAGTAGVQQPALVALHPGSVTLRVSDGVSSVTLFVTVP